MPRYPHQLQQEDKSRAQLSERFVDLGWKLDSFQRDLGEDLHGRIYEQGESTGLAFDIQLKSCADIERFKHKRLDSYFYSLDVADLLHWEVSTVPTLLLVWDVNKRSGVWVFVSKAIIHLDKERDGWREKVYVRVPIPTDQDTTNKGFTLLRMELLAESFSSVSRWFMRQFNINFPPSEDSQADLQQFLEAKRTGESVEVDSRYLQFSERDQRLLGPLLDWNWKVTMGSRPSDETFPIKLIMEPVNGERVEIPYMEIRLIKKGDDLISFSNANEAAFGAPERKGSPLRITLSQNLNDDAGLNFRFDTTGTNCTVAEVQLGINFVNALAKGGHLTIDYLRSTDATREEVPAGLIKSVSSAFDQYIGILRLIEEVTGCSFRVPDWKMSEVDYENIDLVLALHATGKAFVSNYSVGLNLNLHFFRSSPEVLENFLSHLDSAGRWTEVVMGAEEQHVPILGVDVPLGLCSMRTAGRVALTVDELRGKILNSMEDVLEVPLTETRSVIEQQRMGDCNG